VEQRPFRAALRGRNLEPAFRPRVRSRVMRPACVSNRIGYHIYAYGEVHFVVLRMGSIAGWIEAGRTSATRGARHAQKACFCAGGQIVGIVGNVKQFVLTMDSQPQAFVSYPQLPARTIPGWTESRVHKSLVIRTQSTSAELIENVRRTISGLVPDSPVFGVRTVEQTVSNSARPWSVLSQLSGLFATMALILAAIGIYGVISYSVGERCHELGLRMALGALPKHVVRLVLGQAMILSFLGVMIGVAASFAQRPCLPDSSTE
jgi:hypothetical protein